MSLSQEILRETRNKLARGTQRKSFVSIQPLKSSLSSGCSLLTSSFIIKIQVHPYLLLFLLPGIAWLLRALAASSTARCYLLPSLSLVPLPLFLVCGLPSSHFFLPLSLHPLSFPDPFPTPFCTLTNFALILREFLHPPSVASLHHTVSRVRQSLLLPCHSPHYCPSCGSQSLDP